MVLTKAGHDLVNAVMLIIRKIAPRFTTQGNKSVIHGFHYYEKKKTYN